MTKRVRCRDCGAEVSRTTENRRYLQGTLDHVTVEQMTVLRCGACGAEALEIWRMGPLHDTIARALAEKRARLSPSEIRFLRKHIDLSSGECAEQLGVDPATMSRYENTDTPLNMSRQTERLFRLMVLLALNVARADIHLEQLAVEDFRAERLVLRPHRQGYEYRWEPGSKAEAAA